MKANGSAPKAGGRRGSRGNLKWNESNLSANALEAEQASRTRIDEPKTPFHALEEDGETPQAFPPPARPARPAQEQPPGYHERQLQARPPNQCRPRRVLTSPPARRRRACTT